MRQITSCKIKLTLFVLLLLKSTASFSQDPIYEIYALTFGGEWHVPVKEIAVGTTSKDSVRGCFMIWVLKGNNGRTIMVDAGYTDTAQYPKVKYVRPDNVLKKINLAPGDITDIIITHPHFDHIGGIDLFPKARLWLQKEDYDYFVGTAWQKGGFSLGLNKDDVLKLVKINIEGRLNLVKGDNIEIIPGIKVFIGSKHTYESQYVLVNGTSGKTIIASDNCWYYFNLDKQLPIPTFTFSAKAYVDALKRMKTLVGNQKLIIPGHDALIFSRFPKVTEGVAKIELQESP